MTLETAFSSPASLLEYIEGCVNDYESGESTKDELVNQIQDLLIETVKRTADAAKKEKG